ncbi:MAG TPA: hypothetical protein VFU76_13690 [Terriglobales bacterium]|nr:hypothetical protein [Terriglobales bacterium]
MKTPRALPIVCLVLGSAASAAAGTVVLKQAWVNAFMNRTTIQAKVSVDEVKSSPNPVSKGAQDGDLHMASRSSDVGLPFVSEIVNAAEQPNAVKAARGAQSGKGMVDITGAWRLWFEHPAPKPQIQGQKVAVAQDTNPLHVFEIHPISNIGGADVRGGFHPIEGAARRNSAPAEYEAYDAATAFGHYEQMKITVQRSATALTLTAPKVGYNYTEFYAILGQRLTVQDGTLVLAQIADAEGNSVAASPVRLAFVKGTPPEQALQQAQNGARLHLLGIPRVNLERIANLAGKMSVGQRTTVKLPYELIVVGVYSDAN